MKKYFNIASEYLKKNPGKSPDEIFKYIDLNHFPCCSFKHDDLMKFKRDLYHLVKSVNSQKSLF